MRIEPCLTIGDPNCVLLGDAGFNPAQPLAFPSNFPSEFFYSLVDSDPAFTVTDRCLWPQPVRVSMRIALEGAFANGAPVQGDQTFFARVRFTVKQPVPQLDV